MALLLNEEQLLLKNSARDFLDQRAPTGQLRQLRDQRDRNGFSIALWKEMAEMGWPAINIPEQYGGLEYGFSGLGIVLEESGRTLAASPLVATAVMGVTALLESANHEVCDAWLPRVAAGEKLLAMAFEESGRHRPETVSLTATPTADGFQLNGSKAWVLDGHVADGLVVSARTHGDETGQDGITLFLVDREQAGVEAEYSALLDNHGAARIRFKGAAAGASRMLGTLGGGWPVLEKALDAGRIAVAAELLGIAQESFERTVGYLKERKQFGVPIGVFQALQHRAAILFGEIELCRSVVLRALQAIEAGDARLALFASLAKARAGATAKLATAEAIQMHGGIGMTDDHDIGFFIKRYQALEQVLGNSNYHLDRFARIQGY